MQDTTGLVQTTADQVKGLDPGLAVVILVACFLLAMGAGAALKETAIWKKAPKRVAFVIAIAFGLLALLVSFLEGSSHFVLHGLVTAAVCSTAPWLGAKVRKKLAGKVDEL